MAQFTWTTESVVSQVTAGTPQAIVVPPTEVKFVVFSADGANTGNVFIFKSGATAADGIPIAPDQTFTLEVPLDERSHDEDTFDLSTLQMDADTDGNKLRVNHLST